MTTKRIEHPEEELDPVAMGCHTLHPRRHGGEFRGHEGSIRGAHTDEQDVGQLSNHTERDDISV